MILVFPVVTDMVLSICVGKVFMCGILKETMKRKLYKLRDDCRNLSDDEFATIVTKIIDECGEHIDYDDQWQSARYFSKDAAYSITHHLHIEDQEKMYDIEYLTEEYSGMDWFGNLQ